MTTIGQRIKARREALGLLPVELAGRASVTEMTIRRIESGEVTRPQPRTLRCIEKALEEAERNG